jgi:neutral ceramidase
MPFPFLCPWVSWLGLMNNSLVRCQLIWVLLSVCLSAGAPSRVTAQKANNPAVPPVFKAGFAERDITPKIGMEEPGGYGKSFHAKFHDACKVRAAVFDDGQMRVALVGVDALIVPRHLVEEARRGIEQACGIAPGAVLIGASHSHSSGPTGMIQPGEYDDAPPLVKRLAYQQSSCADAGYLELVRTRISDCKARPIWPVRLCGPTSRVRQR